MITRNLAIANRSRELNIIPQPFRSNTTVEIIAHIWRPTTVHYICCILCHTRSLWTAFPEREHYVFTCRPMSRRLSRADVGLLIFGRESGPHCEIEQVCCKAEDLQRWFDATQQHLYNGLARPACWPITARPAGKPMLARNGQQDGRRNGSGRTK